jgi:hypothetical protein
VLIGVLPYSRRKLLVQEGQAKPGHVDQLEHGIGTLVSDFVHPFCDYRADPIRAGAAENDRDLQHLRISCLDI